MAEFCGNTVRDTGFGTAAATNKTVVAFGPKRTSGPTAESGSIEPKVTDAAKFPNGPYF